MTAMTLPTTGVSVALPATSAPKTHPQPVRGRRYRSLAWTLHKEAVLCAAIGLGFLVQPNTADADLAFFDASEPQSSSQ